MNEILQGSLVAATTAIGAATIFFWTSRAKKKKIAALSSLCDQRGWAYRPDRGPLRHGHRIEGDGWIFESLSRASVGEAAPGSTGWADGSQWTSTREDPGRCTFVLGLRLGGMRDFSKMPPALLSRFLGEEVAGLQPFSAGERLNGRYLLLARETPPAMELWPSRAEELLLAWPAKLPIVIRSSPAQLRLTVLGKRLEKPEDAARLIELGESLLKM